MLVKQLGGCNRHICWHVFGKKLTKFALLRVAQHKTVILLSDSVPVNICCHFETQCVEFNGLCTVLFSFQQEGSLCAQHCLNALLQGSYFTPVDLATLAQQMDDEERLRMAESGVDSEEYRRFLEVTFLVDQLNLPEQETMVICRCKMTPHIKFLSSVNSQLTVLPTKFHTNVTHLDVHQLLISCHSVCPVLNYFLLPFHLS